MEVLSSSIEKKSDQYQSNKQFNLELAAQLKERIEKAKLGGGEKSVERHLKREKLLARDRIEMILDEDSSFLELSSLAAYELYEKEGGVPSAGIITGIGTVHGIE
jgi:3-methylcrotonyl-CoA carboxylase beta subunit